MATSGKTTKPALEGFVDDQGGSLITQGIAFTGVGTAFDYYGRATAFSWDESGTICGDSATISQNVEFPANLTIEDDKEITLEAGKTLTIPTGKTLTNDGTITINNTGTINCQGTITTKTDFYLDDDSLYNTGYQTYQTNAGVQNYNNLPNPYQLDPSNGKRFINWYYLNQASQKVAISESANVLLNEHSFYENSVEQFTVTFSVPTETAPAAQTLDTGGKATDPQLIWADGTVEGWYKENTYQNKWNFGTDTVTGNITLYAKFTCSVTFNSQGGSTVAGATAVYNNPVSEPTAPTRSGYRFDGWYKESACTNRWTFTTAVTRNTTLYAKWVQQFTVTFSVPTGTAPAAQTLDAGGKATDPQLIWADGTVEGWYKENTYQNKWDFGTDTVTGNITLYAKFTCSVTFNSQGGSAVVGETAVYNNPVAEPTAPTRSGYRFDGWYKESACTNIWTFTTAVTKDTTLYAKWVQQFTGTFSVPTGTAPAAQTLDTGSKATDPQLIWADGTVEGWYTDQAFTPANKWNFGTDTVTGNITLYAKFQCTVTFDPNYSGGSSTTDTAVYSNPVAEPTTSPTRIGYKFDGWYKEAECTNLWDFENDNVQGDMTLYAKWLVDEHKVIIPSNPDDHGTVTTDSETHKTGDEVIITATPEEGYETDGLPIVKTEDGRIIEVILTSNPNEYKFIMPSSDVTIEAHFVLIPEPAVDPDGGDGSSSSSKTSDPFMGGVALAIFGVATTGAALLRKRK